MRKIKSIALLMISAIVLLSMIIVVPTAMAAEKSKASTGATSGTTGDCTWSFDDSTGTLTISGKGRMESYSDYSDVPWYSGRTAIKSVVIEDGVTALEEYSFYGCTNLTKVSIPNSVTAIFDKVFINCTSLSSVIFPDGIIHIGDSVFENTAYYNNSSNWQNNVLYVGHYLIKAKKTISGNYSIKNGTITIATDAFEDCDSLAGITIPNSIKGLGGGFRGCDNLKSVYINDLGAWCKIVFGGTIQNSNPLCYAHKLYLNNKLVTNLTIPDEVTSIGSYAFIECESISELTIPDSVTEIGYGAFEECKNLKKVTLPNSISSIQMDTFYDCSSLTSISIPEGVANIGGSAFEG